MTDLQNLTDEELHAEYAISQETLKFHKEQVGEISAQLRQLNEVLRRKKQERDEHVIHYDLIREEFSRRKNERRVQANSNQRPSSGLA